MAREVGLRDRFDTFPMILLLSLLFLRYDYMILKEVLMKFANDSGTCRTGALKLGIEEEHADSILMSGSTRRID